MNKLGDVAGYGDILQRNVIETKRFADHQSAWKKELEKAIADELISNNSQKSNEVVVRSYQANVDEMQNSSIVRSEYLSVEAVKKELTSLGLSDSGKYVNKNTQLRNQLDSLNSDLRLSQMAAGKGVTTTASNDPLRVGQQAGSQEVRSVKMLYYSSQLKSVDVKMLADGEVVIRDYFRIGKDVQDLKKLVSQLREIFGDSFGKLKINGDVLWQSSRYIEGRVPDIVEVNY